MKTDNDSHFWYSSESMQTQGTWAFFVEWGCFTDLSIGQELILGKLNISSIIDILMNSTLYSKDNTIILLQTGTQGLLPVR
jgi:hypothetical protein